MRDPSQVRSVWRSGWLRFFLLLVVLVGVGCIISFTGKPARDDINPSEVTQSESGNTTAHAERRADSPVAPIAASDPAKAPVRLREAVLARPFLSPPAGTAPPEIPPEAGVPPARRVRVAEIDPAWMDRKHSPLFDPNARGALMMLPLWDDCDLLVRLGEHQVVGQDRHIVSGEIPGIPDSRFLLSIHGDAVAFSVYLDQEERHGAVPLSDGRVAVYELAPEQAVGCGGTLPVVIDAHSIAVDAARPRALRVAATVHPADFHDEDLRPPAAAAQPKATAQIDVLMLYTNEVAPEENPPAGLVARVDLAFAEANDEFARSETRVQLRRVGLQRVNYAEVDGENTSPDNIRTLGRLQNTSDGFMDGIHARRDAVGADLVCLLVQRSDVDNIGIAYLLDSLADPQRRFNDLFGFSVIEQRFVAGSSTFSHEIGHNLGCTHDRENASGPGLFAYSYGYRFTGIDSRTYRTIMAYQPGRSVPYFSNPRLTHAVAQRPLGVAAALPGEADNASSINRAAFTVADYRTNRTDPPARGRLQNVSTRAWVGTGEDVMIGGFFIDGSVPKQVLLRVQGPSLTRFNVPDVLLNPELELVRYPSGESIATNRNWINASNAGAIAATGLGPTDDREAALLVMLPPGGYTAIARGENGTTGIAVVEVFETDTASGPKLINLSTRAHVGLGDRAMIGGLVVHGTPGETKRLLLRALGPSLANLGVDNPVFDPCLRLFNQDSEEILDNDDWDFLGDALQDEIRALGLDPDVRRESVLLVDLPPGQYTLVVRPFESDDQPAETGIGLVEAYEITTSP